MARLLSALQIGALVLLATCCLAPAQPPIVKAPPELRRLRQQLNPELEAVNPAQILTVCAAHMAARPAGERAYLRYFDLSDLPRDMLPSGTAAISFGVPSASRGVVTAPPQPVEGTDGRIVCVDLRTQFWGADTWERISAEDPYFREPLVPSDLPALHYLKQHAGNAVIRASWFLFYTYDTTQFLVDDATRADDAFYYQLVYGNVVTEEKTEKTEQASIKKNVKGKQAGKAKAKAKAAKRVVKTAVPKTAAEFEAFWQVDFKDLKNYPIDRGAMVDETRSTVSYRNRILWRVRSKRGKYWRTFDVLRSVGDQDFVDGSLYPKAFDAGEHIFQDDRGAQFYMLSNGKGARIEFADPRIVSDHVSGNPVLLTGASCIHCHDAGILSFRNEHQKMREINNLLKIADPYEAERFNAFFLSNNLDRLVSEDQQSYAGFVHECNGLTPQENATQFGKLRSWYSKPVTLTQAARDIGCHPQELADALGTLASKGRLSRLALTGTPVPRLTWERGSYQEAFLLLIKWRQRVTIQVPG